MKLISTVLEYLLYVCMFSSRRYQDADQQEGSFLDNELPPSTFTSSSSAQNDHKTTVSTSQVKTHSGLIEPSTLKIKSLRFVRIFKSLVAFSALSSGFLIC